MRELERKRKRIEMTHKNSEKNQAYEIKHIQFNHAIKSDQTAENKNHRLANSLVHGLSCSSRLWHTSRLQQPSVMSLFCRHAASSIAISKKISANGRRTAAMVLLHGDVGFAFEPSSGPSA